MFGRINSLGSLLIAVSVGLVLLPAQSETSPAGKWAKEAEFLTAGHERFSRGDFAGARPASEKILEQSPSASVYRSSAGKLGFSGVQIHGGKDNIMDNSLFIDCAAMVSFSGWTDQRWDEFVKNSLEANAIDKQLYLALYPELNQLKGNANHIWRNIGIGCGELSRRDSKRSEFVDNLLLPPEGELNGDIEKKLLTRPGFAPIPFREIGLYEGQFRKSLPAGQERALEIWD